MSSLEGDYIYALNPVGQLEGEGYIGLESYCESQIVNHLDVRGYQVDKRNFLDRFLSADFSYFVIGETSFPVGDFCHIGIAHFSVFIGEDVEAPRINLPAAVATVFDDFFIIYININPTVAVHHEDTVPGVVLYFSKVATHGVHANIIMVDEEVAIVGVVLVGLP